jgi:sugar phosphate isomerase/epimerase
LAAEFASRTISLQPGGPLIGTDLPAAGRRAICRGLEQVLPAARRCGVTLAVEPEPGLLIQTSAEYLDFKKRFFANEDLLKMNCDIGHLFCVGEDPAAVIRRMPDADRPRPSGGHRPQNRVHQHLAPGNGVIDFPSIFEALATSPTAAG